MKQIILLKFREKHDWRERERSVLKFLKCTSLERIKQRMSFRKKLCAISLNCFGLEFSACMKINLDIVTGKVLDSGNYFHILSMSIIVYHLIFQKTHPSLSEVLFFSSPKNSGFASLRDYIFMSLSFFRERHFFF